MSFISKASVGIVLPLAALLFFGAPAVSANDDHDNWRHERRHNDLNDLHRDGHHDLRDFHDDFHNSRPSRREHRRFHRSLKREHRGMHGDLSDRHEGYHWRNRQRDDWYDDRWDRNDGRRRDYRYDDQGYYGADWSPWGSLFFNR